MMAAEELATAAHALAAAVVRLAAAIEACVADKAPPGHVPRGADHERVSAESSDALALCQLIGVPTP